MDKIASGILRIEELAGWSSYIQSPSRETLSALVSEATKVGAASKVTFALISQFSLSTNWKVAQHAALLLRQQNELIGAFYFAHKAMEVSGGNVLARQMYCEIAWARRLPLAVLFESNTLRRQAKHISDESVRRNVNSAIINMMVALYSYIGDSLHARRWFKRADATGTDLGPDALSCLVNGALQSDDEDLVIDGALLVAKRFDALNGHAQARIQRGVQLALLRQLRNR